MYYHVWAPASYLTKKTVYSFNQIRAYTVDIQYTSVYKLPKRRLRIK